MTLVTTPTPPVAMTADPPAVAAAPASTLSGTAVVGRPQDSRRAVGLGLTLLGCLLLALIAYLVLISPLQQARSQKVLYDAYRVDLAAATAPVSALDYEGTPLGFGDPVALLRIPGIDVDQVVVFGTSSTELSRGPGLRRDSAFPGTVGSSVIFGRQSSFGGPFGRIADLNVGAPIVVTTGSGEWTYEVTGIRREGSRRTPLVPGTAALTLVSVSGTPYLPRDPVYVDARLRGDPGPAVVRGARPGTVPPVEDVLATDPSALPDVLLWSLGVLLGSLALAWAHIRWGRWQAWIVGAPLSVGLLVGLSSSLSAVLPNLM